MNTHTENLIYKRGLLLFSLSLPPFLFLFCFVFVFVFDFDLFCFVSFFFPKNIKIQSKNHAGVILGQSWVSKFEIKYGYGVHSIDFI